MMTHGAVTPASGSDSPSTTRPQPSFYGGGPSQKPYVSDHITFTDKVFGQTDQPKCGFNGPVAYWDVNGVGQVWARNTWPDGTPVPPSMG